MKYSIATLLLLPLAYGWTTPQQSLSRPFVTRLAAAEKEPENKAVEMGNGNPCWEDLYDDDCAMTNAAAASFVAAEWVKSMPCGAGIEDCDMPEDLNVPENRPEAGVEDVDVMNFLGLKRADDINNKKSDDPLAP